MDNLEIFEAARCGALPDGFSEWELRDAGGDTVAHIAAMYGYLPTD